MGTIDELIMKLNPDPVSIELIALDQGSPEFQYIVRLAFAFRLVKVMEYVLVKGVFDAKPLDQDELSSVRAFLNSIKGIRMTYPPSDYDDSKLRGLDHALEKTTRTVIRLSEFWLSVSIDRYGRAFREVQQERLAVSRAERIRRRRERQAELAKAAQPLRQALAKTEKKQHVETETCSKCHKRKIFKANLCRLCFEWEHAKLGRE